MQVGRKVPLTDEIKNLGFEFAEKIHILGMDIDSELTKLDENFEKTIGGIKNSIDFWSRFHLTLPGRINVIKSLLFSQILYIGSFIMPSPEKIKILQTTLDKYAIGTMNFAKNRITMSREQGGLGLFDVESFLTSQQAGWVLKAHKSARDNWRCKLRSLCNGNVLCAGPRLIDKTANPILHGLAVSFEKVRKSHDTKNSNFTRAFVLNNSLFFRGPGNKLPLDLTYLELDEYIETPLSRLRAMDFFNVNGVKTKLELFIEFNLDLTLSGYAKLVAC
jgi:hypothetical protein